MGANALMDVLREIHRFPKALQSNFIRESTHAVAALASRGLITTTVPLASGGTVDSHNWRITDLGLVHLEMNTPT